MISFTVSLLRSVEAVRGRPLQGSSSMLVFPSWNTTRTHAHTSIRTHKSLVNFCSREFLFHKKFGHFVRSDTGHVMQSTDVTRQQLIPPTIILFPLLFPGCIRNKVAHDFQYDLHTQSKKKPKATDKQRDMLPFAWLIVSSCTCCWIVPPKSRRIYAILHGVKTQKVILLETIF
jgi:hypothetical protein